MNRIYCFVTGEKYRWLIEPYLHFSDKYWGDPVTIVTDLDIKVDPKHTIVAMPSYCRHFYKDGMGKMIKEIINRFPEPLATINLPDFWPTKKVDTDKMRALEKYVISNGVIARTHLWAGMGAEARRDDVITTLENGMVLNRIHPWDRHFGQLGATSGLLAIWNKAFLNEKFLDQWTWADWELKGQHMMADQKHWYSVVTDPALVNINHVCVTRKADYACLHDLTNEEDKAYARPFVPAGYEIYE
jgi:hypothetical protein